jgi:endonuclease-3
MKKDQKLAILDRLEEMYPEAKAELVFSNPYEMLVATMLSAQCTDKQVNKVTPAVFARYPDVRTMAEAQAEDLYPMVKSCGFKSKAGNIIAACRMIQEEHGGQVPDTREALVRLPGVGRKTANVVMSCAFGADAIAVDTHVFRVTNRLGLADAPDVLKTELQLMEAIPKEQWSRAHHWLIYHGRQVCHARKPECGRCTLAPWCKEKEKEGE